MNDVMEGIVIDVLEYRDHDALLSILRKDGVLIRVSAKGIQKVKSKNAPACQLFTKSRFYLNYNETATLQSLKTAEIIETFYRLREDLMKQSIATFFCEILLRSQFDMEEGYALLEESLYHLQEDNDPMTILCLFQAMINRMHGIEMQCDCCVRCGSQQRIYAISLKDGGFVCQTCAKTYDKVYVSQDLKRFRLLNKAMLMHYPILKQQGGFTFQHFEQLYAFFEEYAGISIKSIQFLRLLKNI